MKIRWNRFKRWLMPSIALGEERDRLAKRYDAAEKALLDIALHRTRDARRRAHLCLIMDLGKMAIHTDDHIPPHQIYLIPSEWAPAPPPTDYL